MGIVTNNYYLGFVLSGFVELFSGKIKGAWLKDDSKRKRKQYSLTAQGRKYMARQMTAWRKFFDQFFSIVGEIEK